ncbi:hypothetical protein [Actinoallomurus rhizosphaericola]|uniref:hypothetical protein n=1 Tax=Actinoallomurus rhizosphaericola TaxID=2952536 RepID=UPI002093C506|nr:hypothetical protein [Actinoallomurus rhizosphaericola]MCO5999794.1 hypothetical protein [Actinoallomurus rhizosphaericola]
MKQRWRTEQHLTPRPESMTEWWGATPINDTPTRNPHTEQWSEYMSEHHATGDERFKNEIVSISTAEPGWQVKVRHVEHTVEPRQRTIVEEHTFPIVAWALVASQYADGGSTRNVEPVFYDGVSLVNSMEYRRMHSEIDVEPGGTKTVISIDLERS